MINVPTRHSIFIALKKQEHKKNPFPTQYVTAAIQSENEAIYFLANILTKQSIELSYREHKNVGVKSLNKVGAVYV